MWMRLILKPLFLKEIMGGINILKNEKWFFDDIRGFRCGLKIKKILYSKKSRFQEIRIIEFENWGRALTLDATIQTTERDEFIYHEMISHVPLFLHPRPQKVLIIGGGDGGVLKEVLKHNSVKEATLVEIDEYVIEASKKYLNKIHQDSYYDKRAKIIVGDGVAFINNSEDEFDLIIIDSTDPVGAAEDLFSDDFYRDVIAALKKQGIMVTQSGAVFSQWEEFSKTVKRMKKFFPNVAPYLATVPTYPSSLWSFTLASKTIDFGKMDMEIIKKKYKKMKEQFKFFNPEIHRAALALPQFIIKGLKNEK